jgi:hypothetical protein
MYACSPAADTVAGPDHVAACAEPAAARTATDEIDVTAATKLPPLLGTFLYPALFETK